MFRVRTPTRTAGVALHLLVMIAIIWCSPWLVTILLKQLLKPFAFRHSKSAIIQYRQPPHQPKPSQPKKRRSFVCGCIRHSALHALAIAGGLRCKGSGDVGRSFVLAPPRTSEAPPPHSMKKLLEILQTGDVVHFGNAVGSCKIFFFSPSLGVTRRRDSRAI